jgi:hypothetical protein
MKLADAEPLKTTVDLANEIKGLDLQIGKLKNQIKHSTSVQTRQTWTRSLNQLIAKRNQLGKRHNQTTGKVATRVLDRFLAHR